MTHHPKKFDVVVVGNVGIDTNVYFQGGDINFEVEANFTENFDYVGQAGGYTARGFAQLGYKTAFIGYVGNDFSGQFILNEFQRDGINTDAVFIDPAGTSRSVNMMFQDGRRKNFYDGKSHMTLTPDMATCTAVLQQAHLAVFHIPNWARHLLPVAKQSGMPIACDLQDFLDIHDPYRQDFIHPADVLFFSTVNQATPQPLMESILSQYPKKLLIAGMGAEGCAVGTKKGIRYFAPIDMETAVIDTNGAGDGLAVGFLSSFSLEQMPVEESIQRGQIVARYTCTQKADTSHLLTREQLDAYAMNLRRNT
jgi:acarbose 7IV-phosphotransferase